MIRFEFLQSFVIHRLEELPWKPKLQIQRPGDFVAWPAIGKQKYLGFKYKIDEYPDLALCSDPIPLSFVIAKIV